MIGKEIIPHALPSSYRVLLSMLMKVIESLVNSFSSVVNHPDHLIQFWRVTMMLFIPINGKDWNASTLNCLIVLEEGRILMNPISNLVSSWIYEIFANNGNIVIYEYLPNVLYLWFKIFSIFWYYGIHIIVAKSIELHCGFHLILHMNLLLLPQFWRCFLYK